MCTMGSLGVVDWIIVSVVAGSWIGIITWIVIMVRQDRIDARYRPRYRRNR